jgi:hypothetical protein
MEESMLLSDTIGATSNVFITARERGKKVPGLCRHGHNQWVFPGREFLAWAIKPNRDGSWTHDDNRVVKYTGFGIGGELQTATIPTGLGTLGYDYPGQQTFSDEDNTVHCLERPIKVSGTPGRGAAVGTWLQPCVISIDTPSLFGDSVSSVGIEFMWLFNDTGDLDLAGTYTNIPLSEIAMFTSAQVATRTADQVYDYSSPPAYITNSRQQAIAYHTFSPITKTPSISLEVRWQLKF